MEARLQHDRESHREDKTEARLQRDRHHYREQRALGALSQSQLPQHCSSKDDEIPHAFDYTALVNTTATLLLTPVLMPALLATRGQ